MSGFNRTNPFPVATAVDSGQIVNIGTTATAFPDKPCKLAKFKAASTNTGVVSVGKIGLSSGVNANGGHQLSAREETGWIPISNINKVGVISTVAGDDVSWWILN